MYKHYVFTLNVDFLTFNVSGVGTQTIDIVHLSYFSQLKVFPISSYGYEFENKFKTSAT